MPNVYTQSLTIRKGRLYDGRKEVFFRGTREAVVEYNGRKEVVELTYYPNFYGSVFFVKDIHLDPVPDDVIVRLL